MEDVKSKPGSIINADPVMAMSRAVICQLRMGFFRINLANMVTKKGHRCCFLTLSMEKAMIRLIRFRKKEFSIEGRSPACFYKDRYKRKKIRRISRRMKFHGSEDFAYIINVSETLIV